MNFMDISKIETVTSLVKFIKLSFRQTMNGAIRKLLFHSLSLFLEDIGNEKNGHEKPRSASASLFGKVRRKSKNTCR